MVAPLGDVPVPGLVRAFLTNGRQGVNYHRGVWHHPVLTIEKQDDFLVVDRSGSGNNCDEHFFTEDEQLLLDPNQTNKRGPAAGPPARARGTRLWKHISSNG